MTETPPTPTAELVEFVCAEHGSIPEGLSGMVGRAFADTVGVALGAAAEPSVRLLAEALPADRPSGPAASVWVSGVPASPAQAALHNGTAAHALDFDDVSHHVKGHPSTVLVPALAALGEAYRVPGDRLAVAYLVGYRVTEVLARAVSVQDLYRQGWHATGVLGVVGAAAAGAHLLRLTPDQTASALAVAASASAGLRCNFGSMTKPLHAGNAAMHAVMAVQLARSGFTGSADVVGAPSGFLPVFAGVTGRQVPADLLDRPLAATTPGVNAKKYPCCYQLQRAADAALSLRDRVLDSGGVDRVTGITVTVETGGAGALSHPEPHTGLEGKFSAPFVLNTILRQGGLGLASFTDEAVREWQARQARPAVVLREARVPPAGPAAWQDGYAVVEVRGHGCDRMVARVDIPRGDHREPMSRSELRAKFLDCVRYARSGAVDDQRDELATEVFELLVDVVGATDIGRRIVRATTLLEGSR